MDLWQGLKLDHREPVCPQLVYQVKRMLLLGRLDEGERLPSRRETAAALEINPNTVQKAYRQLEEEGIIATDGNSGSVVRCSPETRSRIEAELTREVAAAFAASARELGMSFKQAVDLLSELWESGS